MVTLDRDGLIAAIECKDPAFNEALRQEAFLTKLAHIGTEVYLRGLIEISNICRKTLPASARIPANPSLPTRWERASGMAGSPSASAGGAIPSISLPVNHDSNV